MTLARKLALSALTLAALTGSAAAATVGLGGLGNILVAKGGKVTATYLGQTAAYSNDLFLDLAGTDRFIFNNHEDAVGKTVNLGTFAAGTELKFYIKVRNTGDIFYTGDASRNADGLAHAVAAEGAKPNEVYVGFEDLYGGGDRDYDDLKFSFSNVESAPSPVPLPASGLLLAGAFAAMVAARRKSA